MPFCGTNSFNKITRTAAVNFGGNFTLGNMGEKMNPFSQTKIFKELHLL